MFLTEKEEDKMSLTERTEITERKQKEQSIGFIFFRFLKKIKPTSFSVPSVNSSEPCERVRDLRRSSAFSLIEVLVAMAVMIVIVVMVTNMFRDASEAWDMGTQRAEMNTSARAAVEYIARELSCAVAGSIPDAAGNTLTLRPFTLEAGNKLRFTAMTGDDRTLRGSLFVYDSAKRIIQTDHDSSDSPYSDLPWPDPSTDADKMLITNVWRFEVVAYENESKLLAGDSTPSYDSSANSNSLPACVDITIEMLGERDMARVFSVPLAQRDGYVMTNSRVYTTRVSFPNRGGGR